MPEAAQDDHREMTRGDRPVQTFLTAARVVFHAVVRDDSYRKIRLQSGNRRMTMSVFGRSNIRRNARSQRTAKRSGLSNISENPCLKRRITDEALAVSGPVPCEI